MSHIYEATACALRRRFKRGLIYSRPYWFSYRCRWKWEDRGYIYIYIYDSFPLQRRTWTDERRGRENWFGSTVFLRRCYQARVYSWNARIGHTNDTIATRMPQRFLSLRRETIEPSEVLLLWSSRAARNNKERRCLLHSRVTKWSRCQQRD